MSRTDELPGLLADGLPLNLHALIESILLNEGKQGEHDQYEARYGDTHWLYISIVNFRRRRRRMPTSLADLELPDDPAAVRLEQLEHELEQARRWGKPEITRQAKRAHAALCAEQRKQVRRLAGPRRRIASLRREVHAWPSIPPRDDATVESAETVLVVQHLLTKVLRQAQRFVDSYPDTESQLPARPNPADWYAGYIAGLEQRISGLLESRDHRVRRRQVAFLAAFMLAQRSLGPISHT